MAKTKYKKYKIKKFTLPKGKDIMKRQESSTVEGLVIEMKSVPKKKQKPGNNGGNKTTKQILLNFIDQTNIRFDRIEQRFDNLIKKNNLKE